MSEEIILKKVLFGGFDNKEVINCISSLQEKISVGEKRRNEFESITEKITALKKLIEEKDAEIEKLKSDSSIISNEIDDGVVCIYNSQKNAENIKSELVEISDLIKKLQEDIITLQKKRKTEKDIEENSQDTEFFEEEESSIPDDDAIELMRQLGEKYKKMLQEQ
ncbi:MAG: hypothetical protein KBT46_05750 [Ruminococcus sp.]|nr:hypothetical protein [Candidatus Copronaster equi]